MYRINKFCHLQTWHDGFTHVHCVVCRDAPLLGPEESRHQVIWEAEKSHPDQPWGRAQGTASRHSVHGSPRGHFGLRFSVEYKKSLSCKKMECLCPQYAKKLQWKLFGIVYKSVHVINVYLEMRWTGLLLSSWVIQILINLCLLFNFHNGDEQEMVILSTDRNWRHRKPLDLTVATSPQITGLLLRPTTLLSVSLSGGDSGLHSCTLMPNLGRGTTFTEKTHLDIYLTGGVEEKLQ